MTAEDAFADSRYDVTVIQRVAGGRNGYGNATFTESRYVIPGCLVAWTGSAENDADADRATDSATVYDMGRLWPVGTTDRVEINGESWEVDGSPQHWPGQVGGTVIQLRRVRG